MSEQDQRVQAQRPRGQDMKAVLEGKRDALAAVATAYLTPEKLIKIVGLSMSRSPKLLRCTPMSVLSAVMTMSELGLAPNTMGSAYMIPYENTKARTTECQLIIGYRGLVELARRSGEIGGIQAAVVRRGDEWEFERGLTPKLRHVPRARQDADILLVWALAMFKDGSHQSEVMTIEEVEAIRRRSKAGNRGPWVTDYAEMAKKTVLRRLCKLLPLTAEIEEAVSIADRTEYEFERAGARRSDGREAARCMDLAGELGREEDDEVDAQEIKAKPEPAAASTTRPKPEGKPEPAPAEAEKAADAPDPIAAARATATQENEPLPNDVRLLLGAVAKGKADEGLVHRWLNAVGVAPVDGALESRLLATGDASRKRLALAIYEHELLPMESSEELDFPPLEDDHELSQE